MNLKELKQMIEAVEDIIDIKTVDVRIDDSRDGTVSLPAGKLVLTRTDSGNIVLAARYE